jgi:hypothetical protein
MSWKETRYNTSNYALVFYLGLIAFCIVHLCISIAMPRWWILVHIVNNCDLLLIIVKRHLGVIVITLLRHLLPNFFWDGDWLEAFLLLIQEVGTCLSFQEPSLLHMEFNVLYDSYIR